MLYYYLLQQYVVNRVQDDYDNHLFYKKRKEIKKIKNYITYCFGVLQSTCLFVTVKSISLISVFGKLILNYNNRVTVFWHHLIHTTKLSQAAVSGVLLPIPRKTSSVVTSCLYNISYLLKYTIEVESNISLSALFQHVHEMSLNGNP